MANNNEHGLAVADATVRVSRRERSVLEALRVAASHGCTSDELEVELALSHQSVSARLHDLVQRGLVVVTAQKRVTRHGRKAHVYCTKAFALVEGDDA